MAAPVAVALEAAATAGDRLRDGSCGGCAVAGEEPWSIDGMVDHGFHEFRPLKQGDNSHEKHGNGIELAGACRLAARLGGECNRAEPKQVG